MKKLRFLIGCATLALALSIHAQELRREAFDLINLDYPGLEKVKAACQEERWKDAAAA